MNSEMFLRCDCGCETILVWEKEKIYMFSKYFTFELVQKVFCPNE